MCNTMGAKFIRPKMPIPSTHGKKNFLQEVFADILKPNNYGNTTQSTHLHNLSRCCKLRKIDCCDDPQEGLHPLNSEFRDRISVNTPRKNDIHA